MQQFLFLNNALSGEESVLIGRAETPFSSSPSPLPRLIDSHALLVDYFGEALHQLINGRSTKPDVWRLHGALAPLNRQPKIRLISSDLKYSSYIEISFGKSLREVDIAPRSTDFPTYWPLQIQREFLSVFRNWITASFKSPPDSRDFYISLFIDRMKRGKEGEHKEEETGDLSFTIGIVNHVFFGDRSL